MEIKQTALITGATGGFGIQLCKQFARHGYALVITARSREQLRRQAKWLQELYGVPVTAVAFDLNQPGAARQLYDKMRQLEITVDVLVNNAGFGLGGSFEHNPPRLQESMLNVNVRTPTRLCRLFLPGMLERGYGGILNVCSTGSFVPGPYNSVYCASKAYLFSLTQALAEELKHTPIRVTAICPGAMDTGFADRAGMQSSRLFNFGVMNPRDAAREAYTAFAEGRRMIVPGRMNKCIASASRVAPRNLVALLSGMIQKQHTVKPGK